VYLDPPFNSKANYNMIFGKGRDKQAQMTAFTDTWQWGGQGTQDVAEIEGAVGHPARKAIKGIYYTLGECGLMAYLGYMAKRLAVVHKKMRDTASIYLHCDPTASHYLKIVMDAIFGAENFRNEIIWRIGWVSGYKTQKKGWIRNHDTILYYLKTKSAQERFVKEYIPYPADYVRRDGKKPTGKGMPIEDTWNCSAVDVLDSIMIKSFSKEKLGYPTQKPVALLKRIISASSRPGDFVLDPFCGCGTTIAAAEELDRRWIGIDISAATIRIVTKSRPELQNAKYEIHGIPKGMEEARRLAQLNRFQYEHWAISTIPGLAPNDRKNQEGFDGIGAFNEPIPDGHGKVKKQTVTAEVKSGRGGVTAAQRNHLKHHTWSNKSKLGIFLTLERDPATEKWCKQQGYYQMPGTAVKYPKFQVFSAEQCFAEEKPDLPPLLDPMTGKPIQIEFPAS